MNYDYKFLFLKELKPDEVIDYLRKSRSDDPLLTVEEVLAKHEAILDEWSIKNLGAVVPEENKYREVVSGETIKDRPEINLVLRRIESPKIKAIKVVEPQRLTRGDLEDIGRLMKLLKHSNTCIITPQFVYNLSDEHDWDSFERELKRGNDYLEYTKKILNRGRLLSVSQGNYVGSTPPYGYDKSWVMEGKRKCPTLVENKEQADVVRMIFDMYVNQDMGRTNICHRLDDMGIKPPKGELWSPPALKDMLENVHYIGKVKWNWRKTVRIVEDSQILETRPKSRVGDFLVYEGKHEGIISEELFQRARDKQGRNHKAKVTTKIRNPLAGLLYCQCGRAMALRTYKKLGEVQAPPRLLCDNQSHCNNGSVLYTEMIDCLCDILKGYITDFEVRLKNDDGNAVKLHANFIKNLEKKLHDIQAKELSQWEAQANPDPTLRMPVEIFKQLNEKLLKEKEEVQLALQKAYNSIPEPINYEEKISSFQDAVDALTNPDVSALKKNKLLKQCIQRINYKRERPVRLRNPEKRIRRNGRSYKPNALKTGATWTNPPFEVDVQLKV